MSPVTSMLGVGKSLGLWPASLGLNSPAPKALSGFHEDPVETGMVCLASQLTCAASFSELCFGLILGLQKLELQIESSGSSHAPLAQGLGVHN